MNYFDRSLGVLSKKLIISETQERVLGVGLFAVLTALAAFIRIPLPFTPVPITMQTLIVLLSGLYLKKYDGSISQLLYIGVGLIGLPIFANASGGISYILGPTGGYLLGFIMAPILVNFTFRNLKTENTYIKALSSMTVGLLTIHALGVLNLAFFLKTNFFTAVMLGSVPFLSGEGLKLILGAGIYSIYKK